jgi:glycerophosphoryl diester phosphodiesterase
MVSGLFPAAAVGPGTPSSGTRGRPLIIGHRGASGETPENTLAAFELALGQGADGIEFDVHLSADGVPVVIHDSRLNRTTSGRGPVRRHSLAALRRLDAGSWFNRRSPSLACAQYSSCTIPSLGEVLVWVKERGCLAYLEIKQGRPRYAEIEPRVLKEIYHAGVASLVTVISFSFPTLARLRRLDSRVALGIDFTRPLLAMRKAKLVEATCVLPHWAFATPRFLARAHRQGIRVLVWDLDEARWMRRKAADGVDGIVTRYPAVLAEVIGIGGR